MVKIKLNFFESVVGAILLPNIGYAFATAFLIISLIVNQEPIVYKMIVLAYIANTLLMVISLLVCILLNKKSAKEVVISNEDINFLGRKYLIDQISSCEYYICKWYALPIAFVYKQQVAGSFIIKFNSGKKIQFKIFYKEYLKLKEYLKGIVLK